MEKEINLKDFIWDLLEQWKAVLIVALCTAILATGAKYFKDIERYKATLEAANTVQEEYTSQDEHIEAILSELPEDDKEMVQLVLQQEAWLENQRDYFNNSLLLRLDPNSQRQLILSYYIYEASDNAYDALKEAYVGHLKENEFVRAVKNQLETETEDKYVKELISGYYNNSDSDATAGEMFNAIIVIPESASADKLEKEISRLIIEYSKELSQQICSHKIKLVDANDTIGVNEQAATKRTNTINAINALNTTIKSTINALTDSQKEAYSQIDKVKESYKTQQGLLGEEAQDGGEQVEPLIQKPRINKKYSLLGLILGAMLYAFAFLLWVMAQGRVNAASEVEYYTRERLLGAVYEKQVYKGARQLLHSKIIDSIRYKDLPDTDEQLNIVIKRIDAACKHLDIQELAIITINKETTPLVERIKESDIRANIVDIEDTNEEALADANDAVFVIEKKTKIAELYKVLHICDIFGVNLRGSIFAGER